MNNSGSAHNRFIIWLLLFITILLQIMPWSSCIYVIRPNWLLLVLVYWLLALPHRVGIATAFVVGIVIDLLLGSMLGSHAFAFSVVAYLVIIKFQLIRNLALWQQSLVIVFLSICYDLCLFLLEIIVNNIIVMASISLFSDFINGLLWPLIFIMFRYLRRRLQIY